MRIAVGAGLLTLAVSVSVSVSAVAAAAVDPLIANARVQGQFLLTGRVTRARDVPGEHKGEALSRTWTFASTCASGPCPTLNLTRTRQTGTDRLVLNLTFPGTYTGSGSFYAPLRCDGRIDRRGERVPFTITVTVSAAAATQFGVYATNVNATYANVSRINRTRCVASLGSDAATYHGHLVLVP